MSEDIVAKAHQDSSWGGSYFNSHHTLSRDALAVAPDDPIVLYRCLETWAYDAMPVARTHEHASEVQRLLPIAVDSAARSLARPDRPDTVGERMLTFYGKLHLALRLISGNSKPDAAALAEAERLCIEVGELVALPALDDIEKRFNHAFQLGVNLRRRAWQALEMGPPYPDWMRDKVGAWLAYSTSGLGWPLSPLTRDETFRAFAAAELAERTRTGTHPPPVEYEGYRINPGVDNWLGTDQPTEAETDGRQLLVLWLGVDQKLVTTQVDRLITYREHRAGVDWPRENEVRLPRLVERVLSLGFAPDVTTLYSAIERKRPDTVRALIAAGVPVDHKAKLTATKTKHKGVIAALSGNGAKSTKGAAGTAALAAELREAAAALDPSELAWVGSNFGVQGVDAVAMIDAVLAKQPSTPAEALACSGTHPFDDYVLARTLRAAGHRIDIKKTGPWICERVVTSGDVIVDGALIDNLGKGWISVAGDLVCDALITEADVTIGGDLRARTVVWGNYNDGSLVVNGTVDTPRLAMTDHSFECRGDEDRESLRDGEAVALFLPAMLDDRAIDRRRVITAVKANKPFLVGVSPAKSGKATKSTAKAKPAKSKSSAKTAKSKSSAKPAKSKSSAKTAKSKSSAKPAKSKSSAKPAKSKRR